MPATRKGRSITGVTCKVMLHCMTCQFSMNLSIYLSISLLPCPLTGTSPKGVVMAEVTIINLIKSIITFDNLEPQPYSFIHQFIF